MKTFVVCMLALATIAFARPDGEHYTDKYDNINISEILENRRLLIPYIKCTLDQGKCTPEGKELKSHIRDALETECAKCTEVQRKETRRVISHLINNEQDYWKQLTDKYDPDHKYDAKYEKELKTVTA